MTDSLNNENESSQELTTDNMEIPEVPQRLKSFNCLSGLTTGIGALLIILVVAWTGQYRGGFGWYPGSWRKFNWHPMMMTLGMVFLYSNGMLVFRTFRSIRLQRLKLIHTGIMILCFIFTIIGLVAGIDSHYTSVSTEPRPDSNEWNDHSPAAMHIPDMYTLHSWVGLITVFILFSQCIGGVLSFFYPVIKPFSNPTYVRWHVYLATGGFVGALFTSLLGFNTKAIMIVNQWDKSENVMIWFIYLTLLAFGGLSLYLISQDRYKRLARPGDDEALTKEIVFGDLCNGDKTMCCLPWTPNDCARSFQQLLSTPNANPLETVETREPPPSYDRHASDIKV